MPCESKPVENVGSNLNSKISRLLKKLRQFIIIEMDILEIFLFSKK